MQQQDAAFTVVGEDRVHFDEPGHLLMVYQFIETCYYDYIKSQTDDYLRFKPLAENTR